ncbi:MAG: radical SAM protein [Acidobacteriota bacterium]
MTTEATCSQPALTQPEFKKPIYMYLLKVTEFCNLNCPYCYMFNLSDKTYLKKPKIMPIEMVPTIVNKVVALAKRQDVKNLTISLHGGEPMLAGREWIREAMGIFRDIGRDDITFNFFMQTNGVLIDQKWIDFWEEMGIKVGLSMDGTPEVHDRNRIDFNGRGSYKAVARGLALLKDNKKVFTGVLCVMDPTVDGLEIYHHFRELGVDRMDFLWPLEQNWNHLPPGLEEAGATPYADYLIPIFDTWWREDNQDIRIRYFQQILLNIFGSRNGLDSLGGNPISITTIDSDGSIEPVDSLRACADGLTNLEINIKRDPIEAIYDTGLFKTALGGQEGLCDTCQSCALHDVCGGGYLPHRYSSETGFANPTVYCRDVWKLATHILNTVTEEMRHAGCIPPAALSAHSAEHHLPAA